MPRSILIGVDTGGTFTDFIMLVDGKVLTHKCRSTPENPANAVLEGLNHLLAPLSEPDLQVVHGSTVATNALLERKGAEVLLFTTAGFEDVIEIGRQTRTELYNLCVQKPVPLVPAERRIGVNERMLHTGEALVALVADELERIRAEAERRQPESVAIGLLFSYANPEHEQAIAEQLSPLGIPLSVSHKILPEYREYERLSTTVANAYVAPKMQTYLGELERSIPGRLRIMQSNGGSISVGMAQREAVRTLLSGPAGGVVGAAQIAARAGYPKVISFDMGGTSTDVALCDGQIRLTTESVVADCPIRVPMMDIHTVGAGGGSIASLDAGNALKVGPESAGAVPGPICYGTGEQITVTDANLLLGRLHAGHFLGGTMLLHEERVHSYFAEMAATLGYTTERLAEGVLQVANAVMERAIRVISVERGHDPRDFALLSFGGAGALHACELSTALSIPTVIIPPHAGLLSAYGMVLADVVRDYTQTVLWTTHETEPGQLEHVFRGMEEQAQQELQPEGVENIELQRSLDMRYRGQSYELNTPFMERYEETFAELYRQRFGYNHTQADTEIVNLRLKAVGRVEHPSVQPGQVESPDASVAQVGEKLILFGGEWHSSQLYERHLLRPGNRLSGPALIFEYSATTLMPPGFVCEVDAYDNLVVSRSGSADNVL